MKYCKKKPVIFEAFQMTKARRADNSKWPSWFSRAWNEDRGTPGSVYPTEEGTGDGTISIFTPEGERPVPWDNWIIQGVKGDLHTCKPDIFEMTYKIFI